MVALLQNKHFLLVLGAALVMLWSLNADAQSTNVIQSDTLVYGSKRVVLHFPFQVSKSSTPYEEGVLYKLDVAGGGGFVVQFGVLMERPIIVVDSLNRVFKTDDLQLENGGHVFRGYRLFSSPEGQVKKYFRELDFEDRLITLLYDGVDEKDVSAFDEVLDNVQMERFEEH